VTDAGIRAGSLETCAFAVGMAWKVMALAHSSITGIIEGRPTADTEDPGGRQAAVDNASRVFSAANFRLEMAVPGMINHSVDGNRPHLYWRRLCAIPPRVGHFTILDRVVYWAG